MAEQSFKKTNNQERVTEVPDTMPIDQAVSANLRDGSFPSSGINVDKQDAEKINQITSTLTESKPMERISIGSGKFSTIKIPKPTNDLDISVAITSMPGDFYHMTRSFQVSYNEETKKFTHPKVSYSRQGSDLWQECTSDVLGVPKDHKDFGVILKAGDKIKLDSGLEFELPAKRKAVNPYLSSRGNYRDNEPAAKPKNKFLKYFSDMPATLVGMYLAVKTFGAIRPGLTCDGDVTCRITPAALNRLKDDPYEPSYTRERAYYGKANCYQALFECLQVLHKEATGRDLELIDPVFLAKHQIHLDFPYINIGGPFSSPYKLDHHRIQAAFGAKVDILAEPTLIPSFQ